MQRLTGLLRSPNGMGNGSTTLQELMLCQLDGVLQAEAKWQNHLLFLSAQGSNMREVRDLASGMREIIVSLRKENAEAKSELEVEVSRAKGNAEKVKSFTKDLKEANLEVEAMLGETGSNFPTSESSTPRQSGHTTTDINGVTKNQG